MEYKDIKTIQDVETWLNENDFYAENKKDETGAHVTIFYEDGELASTKGGYLLGKRNEFQSGKPFIHDKSNFLKLQNKWGSRHFVLLKGGDNIYKKAKDIYLKEHPLPTEMLKEDIEAFHEYKRSMCDLLKHLADNVNAKLEANYKERDARNKLPHPVGEKEREESNKWHHDFDVNQYRLYLMRQTFVNFKMIINQFMEPSPVSILHIISYANPLRDMEDYWGEFTTDEKFQKEYRAAISKVFDMDGKYDHLLK